MKPFISVICPCYNEHLSISKCLQSLWEQDYPKDRMECFFIDGQSTDNTIELIQQFLKNHPLNLEVLHNPHRTSPYAMNMGIRKAKGSYIIRIDAHASYSTNYFSTLIDWHIKLPEAGNIGVVCKTMPQINSPKGKAIAHVLQHKFGVGDSLFRTGINKLQETETVPFGCFKKVIFDTVGLYDERLTRNQDIELNKRILTKGKKIYIVPNAECTYYARSTYQSFAKNNFNNGRWNILTVFYTNNLKSLSLRHFIPLFFVLFLPISICLYIPLFCIISIISAIKDSLSFFHVFCAFFVLHISYGFGSICGIKNIILPTKAYE